MTFGPTFFCCSKMAVTRRRSKLWWRKAHQSKALVELQRSRRSKRDLKPSWTHFFLLAPAGILREPFYKRFSTLNLGSLTSYFFNGWPDTPRNMRFIFVGLPACFCPFDLFFFLPQPTSVLATLNFVGIH